jgi:SecD-like export protein
MGDERMIDELDWVKRERPEVHGPTPEARLAARAALENAIKRERHPQPFPRLPRARPGWLAPAAALAVVVLVVGLFLGVQARKPAPPASRGGLELIFRAEPTAETPVVDRAAVARTVQILRARLAHFLKASTAGRHAGAGSVTGAGSTIVVHLGAGVPMSRALLVTLADPGALLVFYDWEADVLTPAGRPVAPLLAARNAQALHTSQGFGSAAPGSPGAGSLALYQAARIASEQSGNQQCEHQGCGRLGPEYFAFGAPRSRACDAAARSYQVTPIVGQHCYLAGPADSLAELEASLPRGVSASQAKMLAIPEGAAVLQAVPASFGRAPAWSDPNAQFYVLRDRVSMLGNEIINPRASTDQSGSPDVTFAFTSRGAAAFHAVTARIARRGQHLSGPNGQYPQHFAVALNTQLITVPSIDFHAYPNGIPGTNGADLAGGFTAESARKLASELRSGPLPVTLRLISVSRAKATTSSTSSAAQLVSGSCTAAGTGGQVVSRHCQFVLSDGRRFSCRRQLKGQPTSKRIAAAGCVSLRPLVLSPEQKALISRIYADRACLSAQRLRVAGGPLLPSRVRSPDGELVVASTHPTFIAFYVDVAKASRLRREITHPPAGMVRTHGAVAIVWTRRPPPRLRTTVENCVFR